jgi:hypothetical protein
MKIYHQKPEVLLYGTEKGFDIPEVKLQYSTKQKKKIKIQSSLDAADYIRSVFPENTIELQEQFIVLYLDRANNIKGFYRASIGGVTGTIADPRLILSVALKTLSSAIIISHNHPSGTLKPSEADRDLTKKLKNAGLFMEISVLDHIILTRDSYYSFADENLMGLDEEAMNISRKFRKPGSEWKSISIEKALAEMKKEGYGSEEKIKREFKRGGMYWTNNSIYSIKRQSPKEIIDKAERNIKKMKTNTSVKSTQGKKQVPKISEDLKFIKRFVGFNNRIKTPNAVLTFIKSLQKAITEKTISKKSPFADEINHIQKWVIEIYNKMKGDKKILIPENILPKLVAISGGEEVYPSINLIKRFIGLVGKELPLEKQTSFLRLMKNTVKKKNIQESDPYAERLKSIYKTLQEYKKGVLSITQAELNGLQGIIGACECHKDLGKIYNTQGKTIRRCKSKKYSDAGKGACSYNRGIDPYDLGRLYDTKNKRLRKCKSGKYSDAGRGACSYNKGLAGIMTADQISNLQFDLLPFSGTYQKLLGNPERNFTMVLHGEPGAGKTAFLMKFAGYLSGFGSVLYISSEEYGSVTLQNNINRYLHGKTQNIHFAPGIENAAISDYDFLILDSINDLGLNLEDYKMLRAENPKTAFIMVLQNTKAGQFKGGKEWEHEAQIAGEVSDGTIYIYKNRYGVKGSLYFFDGNKIAA